MEDTSHVIIRPTNQHRIGGRNFRISRELIKAGAVPSDYEFVLQDRSGYFAYVYLQMGNADGSAAY